MIKFLLFIGLSASALHAELPDIHAVPMDLKVPAVTSGEPSAGSRVSQVTAGWEGTAVHHLLCLPSDWTAGAKLPVLVEYAGNGGYKNAFGDVSAGTVEGSNLGWGISAGRGFIWVCLPYVEVDEKGKRNAIKWWGNLAETKRYCVATVKDVCARWGGDAERVILCGFSRGSIGCNFVGLGDDEIAKLWRAFVCHSHYDGVIEKWPYSGADRASALRRLQRLGSRPQWISHEGSTAATEAYLKRTGISGHWTFHALPFRNHTDDWVLRDLLLREQLREWIAATIK
ncbi:MAG: hypothetical protein H7A55_17845 [Verrucomicrobiaceae bacterium]|nr:hypothetical protein [Verrucomicrobiaceae bacterium]